MKKDLKGGIANLLSGADQTITKRKIHELTEAIANGGAEEPEEDSSSEETAEAPEEKQNTMKLERTTMQDETDLLNSIEDEELRKELQERLIKKRLIGRGRPRKNDNLGRRMDGYNRTSLIIPVAKWAKIKEIAFLETLTMKEIVELALDLVIERYESKHGEIKPQPNRPKKDISEIF